MFASPAICIPPWPPPPPYPPPSHCTCDLNGAWNSILHTFQLGWYALNTDLPIGTPYIVWLNSTPTIDWGNPNHGLNGIASANIYKSLPPGTTSITVTGGFMFEGGYKCSAYRTIPTPGA